MLISSTDSPRLLAGVPFRQRDDKRKSPITENRRFSALIGTNNQVLAEISTSVRYVSAPKPNYWP